MKEITFIRLLWTGFNRAITSPARRNKDAVKNKYLVKANGPAEFIKAITGLINPGQTDNSMFLYKEK